MAVTIYKSSDGSAPSIGRTTGALITLLDAVLVNGYGAKPAAGWTKPYSGTNKAVYLQGASSKGRYLIVDDNVAADYAGGSSTTLFGSWGATSVSAQTNIFLPTIASTPYINKPDTVGNGGAWIAVANSKAFYLFTTRSGWQGYSMFGFGDLAPMDTLVTDAGGTFIMAPYTTPPSGTNPPTYSLEAIGLMATQTGGAMTNIVCMTYAGDAKVYANYAQGACVLPLANMGYNRYIGAYVKGPVFSPIIAGMLAAITGNSWIDFRGIFPGLHIALQPAGSAIDSLPLNLLGTSFTFSSGLLSGKTLQMIPVYGDATAPNIRYVGVETSDTWGN